MSEVLSAQVRHNPSAVHPLCIHCDAPSIMQRMTIPLFSPVKGTKSSLSLMSFACFSRWAMSSSLLNGPVGGFCVWSRCRSPAGSSAFWTWRWETQVISAGHSPHPSNTLPSTLPSLHHSSSTLLDNLLLLVSKAIFIQPHWSPKICDAPSPLQFQTLPSECFSATSAPVLSFWSLSAIFSPLYESVQVPTMPHESQQESVLLNLMIFHRADQRVVVVSSAFQDPSQNYRQGLTGEITWLQSKTPVNFSLFSSCLLVIQSRKLPREVGWCLTHMARKHLLIFKYRTALMK